jgi:hypothetical protein
MKYIVNRHETALKECLVCSGFPTCPCSWYRYTIFFSHEQTKSSYHQSDRQPVHRVETVALFQWQLLMIDVDPFNGLHSSLENWCLECWTFKSWLKDFESNCKLSLSIPVAGENIIKGLHLLAHPYFINTWNPRLKYFILPEGAEINNAFARM